MLLLDTHAFVWLASDLSKLPLQVKNEIRRNAGNLYISSISSMEISLLVKKNKLTLSLNPHEFIKRALAQHRIIDFPVDWQIANFAVSLPQIHNDPFDRLIIATAIINDLTIISKDSNFPNYPKAKVLWE